MKSKKQRRGISPIRVILILLCACVAAYALYQILSVYISRGQEQAEFENIKQQMEYAVEEAEEGGENGEEKTGETVQIGTQPQGSDTSLIEADAEREMLPAGAWLYGQNPDAVGWLTVPGTGIDYPVVSTPDDPEYYLRRGFDGEYSYSGTPFVGGGGTVDSLSFIIYGHNIKAGTMFAELDEYASKDFWQEHQDFTFTTLYEERTYRVFAALKTTANASGFPFDSWQGDISEEEYQEFVGGLQENALYSTGLTPEYGTQILLLSTCSYYTTDGRFVVAAYRVS